jgi:hypothetical protein
MPVGRVLGTQRVGPTDGAAGAAIGSVDLDHRDVGVVQIAGQACLYEMRP